mmetsp:Transcript_12354/g.35319  ORF Transcript_12354/g.35319 Transcript_12354/m.35319 type:complete len:340 (+) Transcript_12354:174-1193(+)|eukprot:CAMPEP_0181046022 /NCGR_PEP_ID=MMETSP1070-20121207/14125_1 /TAXON_ID=265543 /ORGANISM="Minutocellus polymorphus, Strain NH13" /LENGTH=339 /DNA_ID=CAMNT_0023124601 /DNA_START=161 /DNA_END=1180 /DNA_ORIENTATION=-
MLQMPRTSARLLGGAAMLAVAMLLLSKEDQQPYMRHMRRLYSGEDEQSPKVKVFYSSGRLGNHMREWASAMAVSLNNKRDICTSANTELKQYFKGPFPDCSNNEQTGVVVVQNDVRKLTLADDDKRDITMKGFSAKCKNFAHIHDEVVEAYTPLDEHKDAALKFLEPHRTKVKVGIHVRQGDKAGKIYSNFLPSMQYFADAIAQVRKDLKTEQPGQELAFFIASDSIDWCKEQEEFQAEDIHFIESTISGDSMPTKIFDLTVLMQMDHFILSEGTFGWWAAWLGAWYRGGTVYHSGRNDPDNWCDLNTFDGWVSVVGHDPNEYYPGIVKNFPHLVAKSE